MNQKELMEAIAPTLPGLGILLTAAILEGLGQGIAGTLIALIMLSGRTGAQSWDLYITGALAVAIQGASPAPFGHLAGMTACWAGMFFAVQELRQK